MWGALPPLPQTWGGRASSQSSSRWRHFQGCSHRTNVAYNRKRHNNMGNSMRIRQWSCKERTTVHKDLNRKVLSFKVGVGNPYKNNFLSHLLKLSLCPDSSKWEGNVEEKSGSSSSYCHWQESLKTKSKQPIIARRRVWQSVNHCSCTSCGQRGMGVIVRVVFPPHLASSLILKVVVISQDELSNI